MTHYDRRKINTVPVDRQVKYTNLDGVPAEIAVRSCILYLFDRREVAKGDLTFIHANWLHKVILDSYETLRHRVPQNLQTADRRETSASTTAGSPTSSMGDREGGGGKLG